MQRTRTKAEKTHSINTYLWGENGKKLSEMALEELWQRFPIQLTEHNEIWVDYYNEMKSILENIFAGNQIVSISTAINGIWAKPIIDILVETCQSEDINKIAIRLEQNGLIRMCTEQYRISLNQGYTEAGFADKVYHVHLRYFGDNNELYTNIIVMITQWLRLNS